ncbi:MAG TPA: VWA domain-containing protein [Bryobacteraceae bacterium]|jgi:VWFA-related protein|nr:VWA domain-containing protein [Bryobacteraceae bacterium]
MRAVIAALGFGAALLAQKPDIRVEVGAVNVACEVTDRRGAPVKNLTVADFELRDNGRLQAIDHLWQEDDLPLTIGLVVDVSGSQSAFIQSHRDAVTQFLKQVMRPRDRAFIVTVGPEAKLLADLTSSVEELRRRIELIDVLDTPGAQFGESCEAVLPLAGCGGTALWNGVYASARQKMKWVQGRKALIVLSDGLDTGSMHSLGEAIEAAQETETVAYAIKYIDPGITPAQAGVFGRKPNRGLERLTDETGGWTFPNPQEQLSAIFSKIEADLRNQYVLGFTPPPEARDGRFHKLEVRMHADSAYFKDVTVRARAGYFAPAR